MSNYHFSYTTESYRDGEVFVVRLYEGEETTSKSFLGEARYRWTLYDRPHIDVTNLEATAIGQAISKLVNTNSSLTAQIHTLDTFRLERING